MALNFPNSPTAGDTYTDPTSGITFEYDGTVWFIPANTDLVFDTLSDGANVADGIQSGQADTTANTLLLTGAGGLLGDAIRVSDWDAHDFTALIAAPIGGNATGAFSTAADAVAMHVQLPGGQAWQVGTRTETLFPFLFTRYKKLAGWEPWAQFWTESNVAFKENVVVADDAVAGVGVERSGLYWIGVDQTTGTNQNAAGGCLASFGIGSSPRVTSLFSGTDVTLSAAALPNGTSGVDGDYNYGVNSTEIRINNRSGQQRLFTVLSFGETFT